jgi:hypothetical protein
MNIQTQSSTTAAFDMNNPTVQKSIQDLLTPWKLKVYFLLNLPSAWFWGIRLKALTPLHAVSEVPYGWFTKNPFQSIYFATQAGAGEFPSGVLAKLATQATPVPVSMLVRNVQIEFVKKATAATTFTCSDGQLLQDTVRRAVETGEGQACTITVTGTQNNNEVVSIMKITWSFKAKQV